MSAKPQTVNHFDICVKNVNVEMNLQNLKSFLQDTEIHPKTICTKYYLTIQIVK